MACHTEISIEPNKKIRPRKKKHKKITPSWSQTFDFSIFFEAFGSLTADEGSLSGFFLASSVCFLLLIAFDLFVSFWSSSVLNCWKNLLSWYCGSDERTFFKGLQDELGVETHVLGVALAAFEAGEHWKPVVRDEVD